MSIPNTNINLTSLFSNLNTTFNNVLSSYNTLQNILGVIEMYDFTDWLEYCRQLGCKECQNTQGETK